MKGIIIMDYALLTNELRDEEADILISMLGAYGIKAHKEYEGAAGIVKLHLGTAVFGVKVMVAAEDLDEAKGLMNSEPVFDDIDFDETDGEEL